MATDDVGNAQLVEALRASLKKNEQLRREVERTSEPIAVVGMACRLPGGVDTPEDLWALLDKGAEAVGPLPGDRGWDVDALLGRGDGGARSAMGQGSFLEDAAGFDAGFFGISPREAEAMEPQQRLFLEVAWEAIERAGIPPTSLNGTDTGVYVGAIPQEYGPPLAQAPGDGFAMAGTTTSVISGRVAYTLGLTGPALTVDTACSASLVAVHLAARALRAGECALAVAGGTTVMSDPGLLTEFTHLRGLAPDGRCKAFGAGADGAGFSEGAGAVLLERLSDARRNGHPVLAVIRGSAVNQDGASNGLTAPNGPSQERVIRAALADAGLAPGDVDLLEAHGTGTTLGDPIEAQALLSAYGTGRNPDQPLWLGSLKSNVGHTQAAAGVAGLMKLVLALRHGTMPRTLHADEPSGHVDWSPGTLRLLNRSRPWPEGDRPRRGAVSSFGMSGTNAHVVVEEPPVEEPSERPLAPPHHAALGNGIPVPWVLSARDGAALAAQASRLRQHLQTRPEADPVDVGRTLAADRDAFEHRAVVIGRVPGDHLYGLDALAAGRPDPTVLTGRAPGDRGTVLVFPGQGGQWAGMAVELLRSSPRFAARIAECEAALAPHVDWSLGAVLRGEEGAASLDRVDVVQPALWAVMVALADLWTAHGLRPDAVVGHSQGEVAAACVAGALSLEDGAAVVAVRSRAVLTLSGTGGMLSVARSEEQVLADIADEPLHVAVVNSPSATVVAGDAEALDRLADRYEEQGVRARRVAVDYASHTPHVQRLRETLLSSLATVTSRPTDIPMYSTLTGQPVRDGELDALYWYRNLSEPVNFQRVTEFLLSTGHGVFVEVGPHPVLSIALQETAEAAHSGETAVLATLRRDEGGPDRFLASMAEAHAHGVPVDWSTVFGPGARSADLPTYPFQRRRYWRSRAVTPAAPTAAPEPGTAGAEPEPGPARTAVRAWTLPEGLSDAERQDAVMGLVRTETAVVLGHPGPEEVELRRGFLDAGGTSLAAVTLRNRLNELTGLNLPVTVVLDHPTPVELTAHLLERLASDERTPVGSLLEELDRLEASLSAAPVEANVRDEVEERLRGLLRRLGEGTRTDGGRDLEEASDDQLLELIDQEFGIS